MLIARAAGGISVVVSAVRVWVWFFFTTCLQFSLKRQKKKNEEDDVDQQQMYVIWVVKSANLDLRAKFLVQSNKRLTAQAIHY